MKKKFNVVIGGIILFIVISVSTTYGQPICGGGPHWIDECSGGSDSFQSTATIKIDADFNCTGDVLLTFQGPTSVVRQASDMTDPGNAICSAPPGHIGNFHIQMEITDATLTAPAPGGGQFILKIGHPANPQLAHSFGHIVEMAADDKLGCSFFDVFFEIFVPAGAFGSNPDMWLFNHNPMTLYATITQAPPLPGTDYSFPQCIPLFTDPLGGTLVANATDPHHTIFPVTIPTLSQWGLIILSVLLLVTGSVFIMRRRGSKIPV
jgi:hypothetical protein